VGPHGCLAARRDVTAQDYGSAPATFAGSDVGVSATVTKSVGDLVDNQLWEDSVPGYQTTTGWVARKGWGTVQQRGPLLLGGVAAGLIGVGLYSIADARYHRM
jgi:hypothetical protein